MENDTKKENQKKFVDYKGEILKVLNEKLKDGSLGISEKVSLVDGFFMQSFQDTPQGIQIGGKTVPSVMLVGENSGRVYFFALKVLLPEIDI